MDTEKHGSFRLFISARITRINTALFPIISFLKKEFLINLFSVGHGMDTEKHGSFRLFISARITRINTAFNEKSPLLAGSFH